jgi:hypothetical protein
VAIAISSGLTFHPRSATRAQRHRPTGHWISSSRVSRLPFQRAERLRLALIPFWQDYRVLAAALLALTAGVVIAFK